jgi:hypothetical protein
VPPSYGGSQQGNYRDPPAGGGGRAGTRLLYGAPAVLNAQDATPSASPIPGQGDPRVTGSISSEPHHMAALPPEVRPETDPNKELLPQFRRTLVDYPAKEPAGKVRQLRRFLRTKLC